jgi:hypothetical protein
MRGLNAVLPPGGGIATGDAAAPGQMTAGSGKKP